MQYSAVTLLEALVHRAALSIDGFGSVHWSVMLRFAALVSDVEARATGQ